MPSNPLKETISKLTSPKIKNIPQDVEFTADFSDIEAMQRQRYRVVLHSNKDKVVYVKTEKEQRKLQERDARMVLRQRRKAGENVDEDYEQNVEDYIEKTRSSSETLKDISNFQQFDDTVSDILTEEQLALLQEEEDSTAIEKAIADSESHAPDSTQAQEDTERTEYERDDAVEDDDTADADADEAAENEKMPVVEGAEVFSRSSDDDEADGDESDDGELVLDDSDEAVADEEPVEQQTAPEEQPTEVDVSADEVPEDDEEEMKEYELENEALRREIEKLSDRIHELEEQNKVLRKEFNEEHGSVRVSNGLKYSPGLLKSAVSSRKETGTPKPRSPRATTSKRAAPKPAPKPSELPASSAKTGTQDSESRSS